MNPLNPTPQEQEEKRGEGVPTPIEGQQEARANDLAKAVDDAWRPLSNVNVSPLPKKDQDAVTNAWGVLNRVRIALQPPASPTREERDRAVLTDAETLARSSSSPASSDTETRVDLREMLLKVRIGDGLFYDAGAVDDLLGQLDTTVDLRDPAPEPPPVSRGTR